MGDIQEFQFVVLNWKNKSRIKDREMERNRLTHRWSLIHATIHFHKPDLFLTITTNPKWLEIVQSLFSRQTATDYPDIVLQVFE